MVMSDDDDDRGMRVMQYVASCRGNARQLDFQGSEQSCRWKALLLLLLFFFNNKKEEMEPVRQDRILTIDNT